MRNPRKKLNSAFASPREISNLGQGLTAVEKIFNKNIVKLDFQRFKH